MSENKTKENDSSVVEFLDKITPEWKKNESFELLGVIKEITGHEPKMWGGSLIGYGKYHYKYDSGREGDFFKAGFSPRKQAMTVYIMAGFNRYEELLSKLGKHKTGKSCLYIKSLADVDMEILKEIIKNSYYAMSKKYPD